MLKFDNGSGLTKDGVRARARGHLERLQLRGRMDDLRSKPLLAIALVFSLLAAFYWFLVASDRFVSESRVIVQQTRLESNDVPSLGSLLIGSPTGNRADQLVMRDYLLSRDMVAMLDEELGIAEHYHNGSLDPFSRLNSTDTPEDLYEYYLDRVTVEYDEYGGMLIVEAQAFSPEMAQKITTMLVSEGARFMNETAQGLANDQLAFLREKVTELNNRAATARQAVISYQNANSIASPEAQATTITGVVSQLEARKSELQVELASQSAFLVDEHPILVELRRQIAAIDRQIAQQNARLANPRGGAINSKVERLDQLKSDAQFAEQLYRTALTSLEKGQAESTRTIKTLTVIQKPNLPQKAELPGRFRQTLIYTIVAFLVAGVLQLLAMIIRDHRD